MTGTFTNADGKGAFNGTFTPQKFSAVNGVRKATGVLKGTLTDANGSTLGTVNQTVTDSVSTSNAAAPAACNVLNPVLGPLNLSLLGLVVTLNQVHRTITAVPGAGNLLGNLLCAVASLQNGTGSLSSLSALLIRSSPRSVSDLLDHRDTIAAGRGPITGSRPAVSRIHISRTGQDSHNPK